MSVRTVKVSNVSSGATEWEIKEFFSFSGSIEYLEMKSEDENTQTAFVTFKDENGAETAVLLSGATIVDKMVNISLDSEYQLPPDALNTPAQSKTEAAYRKAEDVVSTMLAKGFLLRKDAVNQAKALDEKHQLSTTASAKVASIDQKIGLTEKITIGTAIVNDKVKEVDAKYQVSEKTKSALAVAEQKVSTAGSAIMKNRYVFTSAAWVTGAFNKVAKAAGEVGQKAQEKIAEEEQKMKEVNQTDLPKDTDPSNVIETAPRESDPSMAEAATATAFAPNEPEAPKDVAPAATQPLEVPPKPEAEPEKI